MTVEIARIGGPEACRHCHTAVVQTELGYIHVDGHGRLLSWLCQGLDAYGWARTTLATPGTELRTPAASAVSSSTAQRQIAVPAAAARADLSWPPQPSPPPVPARSAPHFPPVTPGAPPPTPGP